METQTISPKTPAATTLSANALAVLEARYLKKDAYGHVVETPAELFLRVATAVAAAEKDYGLSPGAVETIRE